MATVTGFPSPSWQIEQINLTRIETDRVRDHEVLFHLLASASFVESGADLYTCNLIEQFRDSAEISKWLVGKWEAEELHHGKALRTYIQYVWPQFDWRVAFDDFFDEYAESCNSTALEPTHAQELAARCVIETGTSSLYRAINACSNEPVLREIAEFIRRDEIDHFKYFYQYFSDFRQQQRIGRWRIAKTIFRRLFEARNDDAECALRHVFAHSRRLFADTDNTQATINRRVSTLVKQNWPIEASVKMLLKPLELSPRTQKLLQRPLQGMMRVFLSLPM